MDFICEQCGSVVTGTPAPCGAECCDDCCEACYYTDVFCEFIDKPQAEN